MLIAKEGGALKKIKTKQTKKDVRTSGKATDVTRRAKNAYIHTKEKSERHWDNHDSNCVNYASNIVSDRIKAATEKGKYIANKYARKTIEKIKSRKIQGNDPSRGMAKTVTISSKKAKSLIKNVIKKAALAIKGTTLLIVAGGSISFVIIFVICLAGFLLSSAFGIFFSNESPGGNTPTMAEVVRQLNKEFYTEIEQIEIENPHDTFELHSESENKVIISNWHEILPVYAVKTAGNYGNSMDVTTLDEIKIGILRNILLDMNQINYWIETIEHEETIADRDEDDNEIESIIITTETILHIDLASKTYIDMIVEYSFNLEQVKLLNELMQDEYQELFMQLIES